MQKSKLKASTRPTDPVVQARERGKVLREAVPLNPGACRPRAPGPRTSDRAPVADVKQDRSVLGCFDHVDHSVRDRRELRAPELSAAVGRR